MVQCPGCQTSVSPMRFFDRSPKTHKGYFITRCPKERCKFNLDIEAYEPPKGLPEPDDKKRIFWKDIFK